MHDVLLLTATCVCRLNGKLVAMENFAGSRCFHEGRIDIIRSTTSASLAFVKAMVGKGVPVSEIKFAQVNCYINCLINFFQRLRRRH